MDRKILLSEQDIPTYYYNLLADLPSPMDPPLHPGTKQPITPDDMLPLFPMSLIEQEMSAQPEIPIPEEVREAYLIYRPTPVIRAFGLEKALQTPAKIYYKYEGVSPTGSHKPNTAIAQAFYNKVNGTKKLVTETGAGQWGSSLAFACHIFGLECTVYMVRVSYEQKPYRKTVMNLFGAEIFASPSNRTEAGRKILEKDPDCPGSLGIAISEAIEEALQDENTKYSLGSVLNHVLLHQTVIGLEAQKQMQIAGDYPDVIIGCHGGGSNFAGLTFPFIRDKINGREVKIVAAEPISCPTLTQGTISYDFGDTAGFTPLLKMHTLGHDFIPPTIHAGGLRYHGAAPMVSKLLELGLIEARAFPQNEIFSGSTLFARTEGIIPAPESAHAVQAAIAEAVSAKEEGVEKTILFNLSGHGLLDLSAYEAFLNGKLVEEKQFSQSQSA
ncbi:MAG: TrpB-like pyridoxal phosphate-dependent enzyme [Calditrichaeota bacterium]|nr:MAG: TrpB-like pyridoxal phosphate-dependent enzyme [Calditrichota bacterium]